MVKKLAQAIVAMALIAAAPARAAYVYLDVRGTLDSKLFGIMAPTVTSVDIPFNLAIGYDPSLVGVSGATYLDFMPASLPDLSFTAPAPGSTGQFSAIGNELKINVTPPSPTVMFNLDLFLAGVADPALSSQPGLSTSQTSTLWVGTRGVLYSGTISLLTYGSAVPEPASWLMLIAGIGMAGGALRTSRRKSAAVSARYMQTPR